MNTSMRFIIGLLAAVALGLAPSARAQDGDTNKVHADYRNVIYTGTPPAAPPNGTTNLAAQLPEFTSIGLFSGSAATSTNNYPNDGVYALRRSVIATPFDGAARLVIGRTFRFGEVITNLASLEVKDTEAPAKIDPPTGARFVPGLGRTVGTEVGFVTITWYRKHGTGISSPVTYYIQEPVQEAVRIYDTKDAAGRPTGAPVVTFPNDLLVTPYYNQGVPSSVLQLTGSVLESQSGKGKIILDYRNKTSGAFLGLEVLELLPFERDHTTTVEAGAWLTPETTRGALVPLVSRGLRTNEVVVGSITNKIPPFAYQFLRSGDPNHGRVFAVRPVATDTNIEVFWLRTNLAGVVWPYEMHRYNATWPADFPTVARRLYVTETADGTATRAPEVNIPVDVAEDVHIHYNDTFAFDEPTKTRTIYLESRNLKARALTGRILLHYEKPGFVGLQFVEVVPYAPDKVDDWDIGDRLLPFIKSYAETHTITPTVTRGLSEKPGDPYYVYQHAVSGPMKGFTFATRLTTSDLQVELFWWRYGLQNVAWPYEMHRYRADWPPIARRDKYQLYVRGSTPGNLGPDVDIPDTLQARVEAFQQPAAHTVPTPDDRNDVVLSGQRFQALGPGWSLLRYLPGNEVYFQVVHSVLHTDAEFEMALNPWTIGHRITESSHQGPRGGYIHVLESIQPKEDRYHWQIYLNSTNQMTAPTNTWDWMTNAVYAVNRGQLEVWWSNVNTNGHQPVQWPSLVKRYDNVWPTDADRIDIANQRGTGPLNLADADLYIQNDPGKPGYNPNDEHADFYTAHGSADLHLEVAPASVSFLAGTRTSANVKGLCKNKSRS